MEARLVLLFFTLCGVLFSSVHSTIFTIRNNCPWQIYPAILTGSGGPALTTGFALQHLESRDVDVQPPWTGRIWARFVCSESSTRFTCLSGDCDTGQISCNNQAGTPPATLLEYNLSDNDENDFYALSLLDGFNLPIKIEPQGVECRTAGCFVDINAKCPPDLAILNSIDGAAIGCKSACLAYKLPQYCCTPPFSSPSTCKPTNYSMFFEGLCPDAASYAFDGSGTYTCPKGANYLITYCP